MKLLTVGHGADPEVVFSSKLTDLGVTRLVDVRRYTGSRRSPQFGDSMPDWLGAAGVQYDHVPALGGRRRRPAPENALASDGWWRVEAFANYAAHTRTREFIDAYCALVESLDEQLTAVMCGEPCWWRCHRRFIADLGTVDGIEVDHIMPAGSVSRHVASEWAAGLPRARV